MRIKMEWQVRALGQEKVDDLVEFANETRQGLIDAELVPEDSWVEAASHTWERKPDVIVRWDSIVQKTAGDHEPTPED